MGKCPLSALPAYPIAQQRILAYPIRPGIRPGVYFFFAVFLSAFFLVVFFIGLPQHQITFSDTPQQSTTTSLPQGTQLNLSPLFTLAILPLLSLSVGNNPYYADSCSGII